MGHGAQQAVVAVVLTSEAGVPQVPLGLQHDVGQAGDGHTDVGGVALGGHGWMWCRERAQGWGQRGDTLPDLTWQPGRRARAANQVLCRAAQSCSRSSGACAQDRTEPPCSCTSSSAVVGDGDRVITAATSHHPAPRTPLCPHHGQPSPSPVPSLPHLRPYPPAAAAQPGCAGSRAAPGRAWPPPEAPADCSGCRRPPSPRPGALRGGGSWGRC